MKPPIFDDTWSGEVKRVYDHDMQEIWDDSISPHIYNMYHNQLETYLSLVPKGPIDILDVGCAQGTLALLLAEQGHRVTAVDIRGDFIDYAKLRWTHGDICFVQGNALELQFDTQFDMIFANQIIEHLVYPERFIEALASLLKPAGTVVVSTPNGEYIRNRLPSYCAIGDPSKFEELQFTADGDGHFFAYTGSELREIGEKSGLDLVDLRYFESPWISGHMKFRFLHKKGSYKILKYLDRVFRVLPFSEKFCHQLLMFGVKPSPSQHSGEFG